MDEKGSAGSSSTSMAPTNNQYCPSSKKNERTKPALGRGNSSSFLPDIRSTTCEIEDPPISPNLIDEKIPAGVARTRSWKKGKEERDLPAFLRKWAEEVFEVIFLHDDTGRRWKHREWGASQVAATSRDQRQVLVIEIEITVGSSRILGGSSTHWLRFLIGTRPLNVNFLFHLKNKSGWSVLANLKGVLFGVWPRYPLTRDLFFFVSRTGLLLPTKPTKSSCLKKLLLPSHASH